MPSYKSITIRSTQYIPICSAVLATMIAGALSIIDYLYPDISIETVKILYECTVASAGFFIIFCLSWYMHLCWSQVLGIFYTYMFFVCLWLTRYIDGPFGIFGRNIRIFHLISFTTGILYCSFVVYNCIRKKCHTS